LKNSIDHPSGTAFSHLDQAFHGKYVEAAAGPRLLALHQSLKPQVDRYIWLYVTALADQIPTSVREHEVIIQSIKSGNANAAQRAIRTNWRNASERLARVMEHLGERGHW
jgi:DNA-binding GntR family transcriptional regulator